MVRMTISTLLLWLAACGPSMQVDGDTSGVALAVDRGAAGAGETVELTLTNDSGEAAGYNLCTSTLEVREGSTWEAVTSDRICTMELRTLEPGASATYPLELPADLPPGEYRVVTTVEHLGAGERSAVRTTPFSVSD